MKFPQLGISKCQQCSYAVITKEQLDKLGSDPCETCTNLSNWKPKE